MSKIKKGDTVIVISGGKKGHIGKITAVFPDRNKVSVENLYVKKHVKANPRLNKPGGILEKEAVLDISNVAIYNFINKKADKIKFKELNGKKVRCYKSNDELIDPSSK